MKRILKHYLVNTASLYLVSQIAQGLAFEKGVESLLITGVGLTVSTLLIRPIINILLLPINLITFNLFKWVSNAIALYLVTLIVPSFNILYFHFPEITTQWLDIPEVSLGRILAFVAFSFLLSIITSLVHWILK